MVELCADAQHEVIDSGIHRGYARGTGGALLTHQVVRLALSVLGHVAELQLILI